MNTSIAPEDWFLKSGNRYDNYDRKGPKVFAGEYACHGAGKNWNHFHAHCLKLPSDRSRT